MAHWPSSAGPCGPFCACCPVRHAIGLPLNSNVRLRRTCVHLRFEQNLSIWQRVLLSFIGQCASRKSSVSKQWLRQVRPPRFQQQEIGGQHGCGAKAKAKAKLSHCRSQPKAIQALCSALTKAYAQCREYSPTQPAGRHPAQPNPPLNGRSNGVPPSLGHSRLFAHFLWPRLGVPPLASPLAIR
jgi:hypothetical protein